jgi:hypothetical protein
MEMLKNTVPDVKTKFVSWKLCLDHCWMTLTVGVAKDRKGGERTPE